MQSFVRRLEKGGVLHCDGINAAAQPFLAVLLHHLFPLRPIVAVTEGLRTQEAFQQDISTWLAILDCKAQSSKSETRALLAQTRAVQPGMPTPDSPGEPPHQQGPIDGFSAAPLFYPAWENLPHEGRLPHVDVVSERLETLVALANQGTGAEGGSCSLRAPIVVTSLVALLQRTFAREVLSACIRPLHRGDRIDPLDLIEWLEAQGYEAEAQVTQKGELSLRGGILDLYPLTSPWPVRLEFFGDELESLRLFDPITQISREEISVVTIAPAGELGLLKSRVPRRSTDPVPADQSAPTAMVEGRDHDAESELGTLLDYLVNGSIVLLCEPELLRERAEEYERRIPVGDPFLIPWQEFQRRAHGRGLLLVEASDAQEGRTPAVFNSTSPGDREESPPQFESLDAFRPLADRPPEPQVAETQRREFFAQLHHWIRQCYAVHVFCNNEGERQRFTEIWEEYGLGSTGLWTQIGTLARGFLCEEARVVVVTDAEIFGRYKVQRARRLKSAHAQATRSALDIDFTDLEEGDYVVHLQHGIGRYLGLHVLPAGAGVKPIEGVAAQANAGQECLVLEYAPNDPSQPPPKLYVPVSEAHLVSKYVGTGKARPPLNSLGGMRWAKAKAQAARAVRDVAGDLLSIQAARESQPGHAFKPDTPWQREFEGAFIFEETPDQMRAIVETKGDMERPKPMDRLICGDVGFGKTEVGIRAAFKAVMDGKQVAVLVPTTVLAQQHYNTFRDRMADYPVRIELLSRFRTRRSQQRVLKELATGGVDIVIGTHRLLQNDVAFKDLGLVVIDEEQRFGVLHKEKFKMLRKLVDVLTLSATPIPRTLYQALTGARDMSTIQTPPHDRLPVETIVTQYDERVIRDAIQRELNRGGQVFFLHNRVLTIDTMAQKLRALLPEARVVVGHGQMHSDELEAIMTRFVNGEADVLLSTTIIESGLDIPNANTIIIDRADRFGLSDLYQLRGRVGRYKHQAYAYLLLPRHAGLLADVRKRLSAIKQYSTLGSGFKIAMRDLEIRGAGNLLGAQQSGHITAVGFELYCQLLKQSIASLKGAMIKPRIEVQARLDFLALSPAEESPAFKAKSERSPRTGWREDIRVIDEVELIAPGESGPRHASSDASDSACARACIPFKYISDPRQRIEIYRKLAQVSDKASLQTLERELRDRFGPIPTGLQLLLQVGELKLLAAARGISLIEVRENKLMLTRNNDYLMVGSKFPRLTKREPVARLNEIRKFLLAL